MFKKLLIVFGLLCLVAKPLSGGIAGVNFEAIGFGAIFVAGVVALGAAAVIHALEQRR